MLFPQCLWIKIHVSFWHYDTVGATRGASVLNWIRYLCMKFNTVPSKGLGMWIFEIFCYSVYSTIANSLSWNVHCKNVWTIVYILFRTVCDVANFSMSSSLLFWSIKVSKLFVTVWDFLIQTIATYLKAAKRCES